MPAWALLKILLTVDYVHLSVCPSVWDLLHTVRSDNTHHCSSDKKCKTLWAHLLLQFLTPNLRHSIFRLFLTNSIHRYEATLCQMFDCKRHGIMDTDLHEHHVPNQSSRSWLQDICLNQLCWCWRGRSLWKTSAAKMINSPPGPCRVKIRQCAVFIRHVTSGWKFCWWSRLLSSSFGGALYPCVWAVWLWC